MSKPSEYTLEDRRSDASDAFRDASAYHNEVKEIHQYFMPFRAPTFQRSPEGGTASEGAKRTEKIYDGTGPAAAFAFAANMQADWMPMFEPIYKVEPGPLWASDSIEQRNADLQFVTEVTHSLLTDVRTVSNEVFLDLFAGNGNLLMTKGDKNRDPIRAQAIPITETAYQTGPFGKHERWFWKKNYKLRHLEEVWPDAKIGDTLAGKIKKNRNDQCEVVQYTFWCHREKVFKQCAWTNVDDTWLVKDERHRTSPWITPRGMVVPGEAHGRGLAHLGLPGVRTVNEARKLALRAAAFALLGIWTRRNDGVFNPATATMAPGMMWKVASNGSGGMGRSIERLDIPHNFDVSSIIINDERQQIRRVLLDDELPEVADRVRSPTEIAGRMRRYDRNRGGSTVRLANEFVTPVAHRAIDICEQHGFFPGRTNIDQILTMATVVAPAAAAQRSAKVERVVSWLQIIVSLFGPQAMMLAAEIESIIPQLGRDMGVDEKMIRKKLQTQELKAMVAQMVAQMQAQEARASAPAAAAEPQLNAAAMMNGSGF